MSISPEEAFLNEKERSDLATLEKQVDNLLKGYSGGNDPIYFTHTLFGSQEPTISVLNALMSIYRRAGWKKVSHVITKEGRGITFSVH